MSAAAAPGEIGRVDVEGEEATLRFERLLPHSPEEVWRALTDPKQLVGWYLTEATIDGRPGGRIEFRAGPSRLHVTGRILRWEPPRLLEHEWNVAPSSELPDGERASIRWELNPDREGTLLRLTHARLRRKTALGFAPGTHAFLDRLSATLDGRPLPDWMERYQVVAPSYPPSWVTGSPR